MARVAPAFPSFNAGELSPFLEGRIDFDKYPKGLKVCENFLPMVQGGLTKRPGTKRAFNTKDGTKRSRLIRFRYNNQQSYVLEFGDQYIRFYTNRGILVDTTTTVTAATATNPVVVTATAHGLSNGNRVTFVGVGGMTQLNNIEFIVANATANTIELQGVNGTTFDAFTTGGTVRRIYEIASPYLEADLSKLRVAQSADVLYLAHPDYPPRSLSRFAPTNWVLTQLTFNNGPYLPENATSTTLAPAAHGRLDGGTAAGITNSANVVDRDATTVGTTAAVTGTWTYSGFTATPVDAYWIQSTAAVANTDRTPANWYFEGFNGSSWVTLDRRQGETGWATSEVRYFDFFNTTAYSQYRLRWVAVNGGTTANSEFAEISMHQRAENQTPFNLTASSTTGINNNTGFQTTDVGRPVRLYASDGRWRWARIISRTSTTVVTVQLHDHALPDLAVITRWQLGAWSETTGYPAAVTFFGDRLWWAGSPTQPQTLWGSLVGDYLNHSPGTTDEDGLNLTLNSSDVSAVQWMEGDEKGMLVGTEGGEWIVSPTSVSEALSATNLKAVRSSNYGSSEIAPVRVGKAVLFVQRLKRKIRELAYLIDVDGFTAPNLTVRADHISGLGFVDLAYQSEPYALVWSPRSDGQLAGMTYERDQEVVAWHRHLLGGTDTVVESVSSISAPDDSQDDLWLVVKRTINGQTVRTVEYLAPMFEHTQAQEDAFFVDCGATYDGAPTTVVRGLNWLEGQTLKVLADGAVRPEVVVFRGNVTLFSAASTIHLGLGYTAIAQTERIEAGGQAGVAQGKLKRVIEVAFRLYRSVLMKFGRTPTGTLDDMQFRLAGDPMDAPPALVSGDRRQSFPGGWDRDGTITIVSDQPTPLTVLAAWPIVETTE